MMTASFCFASCNNNQKNKPSEQKDTVKDTLSENIKNIEQEISFTDESGRIISLNSLKGKVVFINFWATWCPPCLEEMPSINKLKKGFKENDDIVFLMVDVDGNMTKSKAFMTKNKYDLQVYVPNGDIPSNYLGGAIPTTVILDKKGNMVNRIEGGRDYTSSEITEALNKLITKD